MANTKMTIIVPDSFERFIAEAYDHLNLDGATAEQKSAAFQEMINLLAILMSGNHGPDMEDPLYARQMEDNFYAWGHGRRVTPEAQAVGRAFLAFLKDAVQQPAFDSLLKNSRRGEESDAVDPGGGPKDQRHVDGEGQA